MKSLKVPNSNLFLGWLFFSMYNVNSLCHLILTIDMSTNFVTSFCQLYLSTHIFNIFCELIFAVNCQHILSKYFVDKFFRWKSKNAYFVNTVFQHILSTFDVNSSCQLFCQLILSIHFFNTHYQPLLSI